MFGADRLVVGDEGVDVHEILGAGLQRSQIASGATRLPVTCCSVTTSPASVTTRTS